MAGLVLTAESESLDVSPTEADARRIERRKAAKEIMDDALVSYAATLSRLVFLSGEGGLGPFLAKKLVSVPEHNAAPAQMTPLMLRFSGLSHESALAPPPNAITAASLAKVITKASATSGDSWPRDFMSSFDSI
jgi:hypothetical protein